MRRVVRDSREAALFARRTHARENSPRPIILCIEAGSRFTHAGCGCGVCMPIEIPRKRGGFFPSFPNTWSGIREKRRCPPTELVPEACKGEALPRRPNSDSGPRFNGFQNCQIAGTRPDRVPAAALAQAGSGGARFSCEAAPPGSSPGCANCGKGAQEIGKRVIPSSGRLRPGAVPPWPR